MEVGTAVFGGGVAVLLRLFFFGGDVGLRALGSEFSDAPIVDCLGGAGVVRCCEGFRA